MNQPHCRSKVGFGGAPPVGAQILTCFKQFGWDVITNSARGGSPPSPATVAEFLQKMSQAIGTQLATPDPKPDIKPEPPLEPITSAQDEGLFKVDDDWGGDDFAVRIDNLSCNQASAT